MGIGNWILNKLRTKNYAIHNQNKQSLIFGGIYKIGSYRNFKTDPSPLIFIMYSGTMQFIKKQGHYTDGINLNYISQGDKMWLARTIFLMKKGNQNMNGATFYKFLKFHRPSIIKTAYRRYHTHLLVNPKLVSAGLTNLYKLVYPFNDNFINQLNNMINQDQLQSTKIEVSYSPTEIQERINTVTSMQNINEQRVNQNQNQQNINQQRTNNVAPWVRNINRGE